jgi:lysophospholipase L1-like esterase
MVFEGAEPQPLRYAPHTAGKPRLRSKADPNHPDNVWFEDGADYVFHTANGTVGRTAASRIPDWREHPLYGRSGFDHRDFKTISNSAYTVYADYGYEAIAEDGCPSDAASDKMADEASMPSTRTPAIWNAGASPGLDKIRQRLAAGESAVFVVFGDSISMGAEIGEVRYKFAFRFAESLRSRFPEARIELKNKAIGGEASARALTRLHDDVIAERPDLVLIGYGMNDQNRKEDGSNSISPQSFERNIASMIEQIRAGTEADLILITPCVPNPDWIFASANVADYAMALRRLAARYGTAIADVQLGWQAELAAGKSHASLLVNNVNHPNEYGHGIYARTLEKLFL